MIDPDYIPRWSLCFALKATRMVGPFVLQTDYRMSYNNEALDGVGRRQVKYEGVAGEDRTSGQS